MRFIKTFNFDEPEFIKREIKNEIQEDIDYDDIFNKVYMQFDYLHPYNYQIKKTDRKNVIIIHCYPCIPLGENDYTDIECDLIELWEDVQKCKDSDDVNNLVNSYC
jgi:hypothetical protein